MWKLYNLVDFQVLITTFWLFFNFYTRVLMWLLKKHLDKDAF